MTKKEKALVTVSSIYLIGLVVLMLMILLCAIFKFLNVGIFIVSFLVYLVIGYIIVTIFRTNTYLYACKKCNHQQKMTFVEAIFSSRGDNTRRLKCRNCGETSDLERHSL